MKRGAILAKKISDAAANEVVFTIVSDDAALRQILKGGLLDTMPKGAVHVSLSTISVAMAEELKELHSDRQQLSVSAPVFGRPDARWWTNPHLRRNARLLSASGCAIGPRAAAAFVFASPAATLSSDHAGLK